MKHLLTTILGALLSVLVNTASAAPAKPNVVYLLADDLGWSDPSTHPGGSIPTPIWTSGTDTRVKKIEDTDLFTNIRVRAVLASELGK
jgi:hypothetical protein